MEKLLSVLSVMQTHVIVTSEKNKQGNKHKKEQTIYSHTGLGLKSHRWFYSLVSKKSVMEWKIMLLNNILVHNLNSYACILTEFCNGFTYLFICWLIFKAENSCTTKQQSFLLIIHFIIQSLQQ